MYREHSTPTAVSTRWLAHRHTLYIQVAGTRAPLSLAAVGRPKHVLSAATHTTLGHTAADDQGCPLSVGGQLLRVPQTNGDMVLWPYSCIWPLLRLVNLTARVHRPGGVRFSTPPDTELDCNRCELERRLRDSPHRCGFLRRCRARAHGTRALPTSRSSRS